MSFLAFNAMPWVMFNDGIMNIKAFHNIYFEKHARQTE